MEKFGRLLSLSFTVAPMHVMLVELVGIVIHPNGRRASDRVEVSQNDRVAAHRRRSSTDLELNEFIGFVR